ncbi:glucose-6-phosphate isomerase family protein [Aeromicrobium sp. P5_D10]
MTSDPSGDSGQLFGFAHLDIASWSAREGLGVVELSTMRDSFAASSNLVTRDTPVIYRTWRVRGIPDHSTPEFSLTKIEAGTVDGEFYMTRGHEHRQPIGESYFGISGRGGLIARRDDVVHWYPLVSGSVVQMPAGWAHRTVNCGHEPFVFSGQYSLPFDSDYEVVRLHGMGVRVLKGESNRPRILVDDNVTFYDHSK